MRLVPLSYWELLIQQIEGGKPRLHTCQGLLTLLGVQSPPCTNNITTGSGWPRQGVLDRPDPESLGSLQGS